MWTKSMQGKASCVSHHDIFTVNFPLTCGHRSLVRGTILVQASHIQKCRKMITILKLHTAEVHWWGKKSTQTRTFESLAVSRLFTPELCRPSSGWVIPKPTSPPPANRGRSRLLPPDRAREQRRWHSGTGCRPLLPTLQLSAR